MDMYTHGLFKLNAKHIHLHEATFGVGITNVIKTVETWTNNARSTSDDYYYQEIINKLKKLENGFVRKIEKHCFSVASKFKVLNHGDVWINNFMFKYDDDDNKKPIDLIFIDYQMTFYTGLGLDLNYFLCTSPTIEVREYKIPYLIEHYYYESFCKILINQYNDDDRRRRDIPKLDAILSEIKLREFYGFAASIGVLPLVLLDSNTSQIATLDNISLTDSDGMNNVLQNALYFGKSYQQTMKQLLIKFYHNNVLDDI